MEPQTLTGRAFLANTGEVFAWLSETPEAARMFSQWYNRTARELGADKPPVDAEKVMVHAGGMEFLAGHLLGEMIERGGGKLPL